MNRTAKVILLLLFLGGSLAIHWKVKGLKGFELPVNRRSVEQTSQYWIGTKAPDFTSSTTDGTLIKLSEYRGQVVLVNFMTSWCPPCEAELPALNGFSEKWKDSGVVVIGVDVQEEPAKVANFVKEMAIPFPVVMDEYGEIARAYGIDGFPTTVIIDEEGIVQFFHTNAIFDFEIHLRQFRERQRKLGR